MMKLLTINYEKFHFFSLAKEKTVYEKEVIQQTERIDKMKAEGKDEYDVKKQVGYSTM